MSDGLKVCVGASSGGHMTELNALLRHVDSWPARPGLRIATLGDVTGASRDGVTSYAIGECNRNTPVDALRTIWRSLRIVVRERPDVIVTTGSLPLALFCLVGRLFGARIVWIDSVSQIDELSLSGRLVRPFASQFFVQWPGLAERFPGTRYAGELV